MTTIPGTFFEISGPDAPALRRFYAETLGITLDTSDETYTMIPPVERGIAGGIFDGSTEMGTYAIVYMEVDDVDATVEQARQAGAKVLVEPRDHGPTYVAHLADPAGNRIGVYRFIEAPS